MMMTVKDENVTEIQEHAMNAQKTEIVNIPSQNAKQVQEDAMNALMTQTVHF